MRGRRGLIIAILLPLLAVAGMALQSSRRSQGGERWLVTIDGYDPRDLVHGHYLLYRYSLGLSPDDDCLCFTRIPGSDVPQVHDDDCDSMAGCDGWVKTAAVTGAQRYLVPEEDAKELERALRKADAQVELFTKHSGTPAVGELFLDGRPWREFLEEP